MILELEQHENGINYQLKFPERGADALINRAVGDLLQDADSDEWNTLIRGTAGSVTLRVATWRRSLMTIQRLWDHWRKPAVYAELFKLTPSVTAPTDLDALAYSLAGVVYTDPGEIPAPPDLACALGTFILATPTLLVTDPCYKKKTWCTGELTAKLGEWAAQVIKRDDISGHSNAILIVAHTSVDIDSIVLESLEESGIQAGVDSGQAGFFEKARYPDDIAQFEYEDGMWYHAASQLTLDPYGGGASIAPGRFGVVSQTFWGDGSYPCLVQKDEEGLVVAAALIFDGSMYKDDCEDDDEDKDSTPSTKASLFPMAYVDSLIPEDYSELETMPSPKKSKKPDLDDTNIVID